MDASGRVTIDPAKQWTRSTNAPFRGMELPGQVRFHDLWQRPDACRRHPIAKEDDTMTIPTCFVLEDGRHRFLLTCLGCARSHW